MPTAPRGAIMPAPPHFAFPNLVPPARIIPPDFELWPEIRMGGHLVSLDLVGLDLRTITLPVTPTIPPTVATGDLITAAHENAVRQALNDLWIDVQALAAAAHNEAVWSQHVDAAGYNLSNVGTLGATTVNATNGSFAGSLSANTISANTLSTTGAITAGSISSTGPLNASEAWISGAVNTATFRSTTNMVFQVGAGYPERLRISAAGNVGIGTANPQSILDVAYSTPAGPTNITFTNPAAPSVGNSIRLRLGPSTGFVGTNIHPYVESYCEEPSNQNAGLAFGTYAGTAVERMRISAAGNVGIGTNPSTKLHVIDGRLDAPIAGQLMGGVHFSHSGPWGLQFGHLATGESWIQAQRVDGNASLYGLLLNPLGGNVGIGTATPNPSVRLEVFQAGATQVQGIFGHSVAAVGLATYNNTPAIQGYSGTHTPGSAPLLLQPSGGSVAIGPTSPGANLFQISGYGLRFAVAEVSSYHTDINCHSVDANANCNINFFPGAYAWSIRALGSTFYILDVDNLHGVQLAQHATAWTAYSDERAKNISGRITDALRKVCALRGVRFNWHGETTPHVGIVAQDVAAVLPEAIDDSNPEKLGVRYTEVIPLLIEAIRELEQKLAAISGQGEIHV